MSISKTLNIVGLHVIYDFAPKNLIYQALKELTSCFNGNDNICVNEDNINIRTINGDNLLKQSPASLKLYDYSFNYLDAHFKKVTKLKDKTIGLSANCMSKASDKFRLHFDRNQITLVIYLNDNNTFPLTIYPNVREDPSSIGHKQTFELNATKPKIVTPRQNLAALFYGRRSFHGIYPVEGAFISPRYSLQFAFDLSPQSYAGERYYGHNTALDDSTQHFASIKPTQL